jgi:FkbM family methyltransferase
VNPLKEVIRRGLAIAGYRITRMRPANRFQAMQDTLSILHKAGFVPRVVVDAGANVGAWTAICCSIFPGAIYHLIEPQADYERVLRSLVAELPGSEFHPVAVTEPGVRSVRMLGTGSSGAWVAMEGESANDAIVYPATTLDEILASRVSIEDRALLKLDLECHELPALLGASRLLSVVEVVLVEVEFYSVNDHNRPTFSDVFEFFRENGFELYDIASLSHRARDMRLCMGDVVFVRRNSSLLSDRLWD